MAAIDGLQQLDRSQAPARPEPTAAESDHLRAIATFFDRFASDEQRWRRRNRTYHRLVESIHRFLVADGASVLEIGSGSGDLLAALGPSRGVGIDVSEGMTALARERHPDLEFHTASGERFVADERFDYVVLSDLVPYAYDLEELLRNVRTMTHERSRIVIHSYSQLWRPLIRLAELLRLKPRKPIHNWVAIGDARNLLELADMEVLTVSRQILFPKKLPLLTTFLNGVVARIPLIRHLCVTWWVVARPRPEQAREELSVSIVVPCRNEAGMIDEIVRRTPELGSETELIFVEGGSSDDTPGAIERAIAANPERRIAFYKQTGKGKGDAVRLGFERARNDLLMILDADLTVAPEDLPKFYRAVAGGHADFANGSRLVYELAPGAMQSLNVLGNKFFSATFSALLEQPVKDTLCGTKVLRKADYEAIARSRAYFGDFDPFGDFDLLLGAARRRMKIVDVPVRYGARTYGQTNISRFRHGWLLLQMAVFAFGKLKVKPVRI